MIILRALWALFLAGFVAYAFRRTWKWEHGAPMPETIWGSDKPRTKETAIWLDPSFLPVLLLIILLIFVSMDEDGGVKRFLSLSLDVMFIISIYYVLLIFLLPILRKHFSARACATMWILPVYMFWMAHILIQNTPAPLFVIYIPMHILDILFLIWSIGFVVVFAGKFVSHFIFRHRVMSASIPVRDTEILALFDTESKNLEYYFPVKLVKSAAVTVPLSMGNTKRTRVTVLPNREFTQQELQFIFRHEIHHLQRGDVSNKIFFAFCQALCWFNPLIWIATRKASDDLELSCDEIVLEDMDEGVRRQYAELLLNTAGHSWGFTTCLSAAAKTMRYRLKNVVTVRKRWPGTLLLAVAMFLCVMSHGAISVSNDRGTVAELITEYRTAEDIRSVYYQPEGDTRYTEIHEWDGEKLFAYITTLDIERLSSANEINDIGGQRISIVLEKSGTMQIQVYDKFIELYRYHSGGSREYYYLRSTPDWDTLTSCLNFDAEQIRLRAPQLRVHFDADGLDEPLDAIQSYYHAWDTKTGGTLRTASHSGPPAGLYGWTPSQAQLVFDMTVAEITVLVSDWDSTTQTEVELQVYGEDFFLPLKDHSAHYQINVVFDPVDGIQYEATFVFDVEYPKSETD